MLIISKYFNTKFDYINVICVNSKFKDTTEKLRFNPIPITSMKLFPNIQTQYLYSEDDTKIEEIENHEIWYIINYDQYLKFDQDNIKCHHIQYTETNRSKYGDIIPENVTMLKDNCFKNCDCISILLSNNIYSIGNECFSNCTNLKSITFPNGLTEIKYCCCFYCVNLEFINFPTTLKTIGISSFSHCKIKTLTIPTSVTSIGSHCFYGCHYLQSIVLPNLLVTINDFCFNHCTSLKSITFPTTVQHIGQYCFDSCQSLNTIILPTSVTSLGRRCFSNCSNLISVEGVNELSIGDYCFYKCPQLTIKPRNLSKQCLVC
ncbi:Leucine rich repeat protein [Entamoeba marina]